MKPPGSQANDARFGTFIDEDGHPPCLPPDGCRVCVLFTGQRPDETRAEWLARILRSSRYTLTGGPS